MPPVFALLPAIFAGAGSAVGLGEGIANLVGSGGTPPAPTTMPAVTKPPGPTGAQVSTATQAGNNLIAQTGGGLSPEALTQLIGMLDTSGQSFGGAGTTAANTIYGTG